MAIQGRKRVVNKGAVIGRRKPRKLKPKHWRQSAGEKIREQQRRQTARIKALFSKIRRR